MVQEWDVGVCVGCVCGMCVCVRGVCVRRMCVCVGWVRVGAHISVVIYSTRNMHKDRNTIDIWHCCKRLEIP